MEGSLESSIVGLVAGPVICTVALMLGASATALMPSSGTGGWAPVKLIVLSVRTKRRSRRSRKPRRSAIVPTITGDAAVPEILRLPPHSASRPRPRMKICSGMSTLMSRAILVGAEGGGLGALGAMPGA